VKFAQKRSAPKWTSYKMGNAKKGHNKAGRSKVVTQKRRVSKKRRGVPKKTKEGKVLESDMDSYCLNWKYQFNLFSKLTWLRDSELNL